jgi:hypothetical protein
MRTFRPELNVTALARTATSAEPRKQIDWAWGSILGELLARFVCIFIPNGNENYGVAAVETGGKQQSPGLLHLMVQICLRI